MTRFNKKKDALQDIKGRGRPLGHVAPVQIPPLDASPITDSKGRALTMEQQAEALSNPMNPLSPHYDPTLADTAKRVDAEQASMDPHALRDQRAGIASQSRSGPRPHPQPQGRGAGPFGGTLPPSAQQDPGFRPGVGSMYAGNQPGLQTKPGQRRGEGILSEETVEGLDAIAKFEEAAEQEQNKVTEEELEKEVTKGIPDINDMGMDEQFMQRIKEEQNELDTVELREAIEERVDPIDIVQLIEDGEGHQDVPIITGDVLTVTFRTVSGEEDLALKRDLFSERGPDVYVYDRLQMMMMTAGLFALNNQPLPTHLDARKRFDKKLFKIKFATVIAYPVQMLASIGINYNWFDVRTRRLFVDLGPLKNG
jgi:hypothetical protein